MLSSLCLAATAAEVSPVRRLLLVLLFDGTQEAPFRRCAITSVGAVGVERVEILTGRFLGMTQKRNGKDDGDCEREGSTSSERRSQGRMNGRKVESYTHV